MSKARSPCTVCSTTIGINGLIFDIIAREVSGYRTRFEAIEKRLDEVEQVNARLGSAETDARELHSTPTMAEIGSAEWTSCSRSPASRTRSTSERRR